MSFPKQFTLEEMTQSNTAARLGINNVPTGQTLFNLSRNAELMLRVRKLLDAPIRVNSGYRSPALNKHIPGSSDTSAHTKGWATDFVCPTFGTPLQIAKAIAAEPSIMNDVDQLIHEYDSWVHISWDPRNRKQILTINKSGTKLGL